MSTTKNKFTKKDIKYMTKLGFKYGNYIEELIKLDKKQKMMPILDSLVHHSYSRGCVF